MQLSLIPQFWTKKTTKQSPWQPLGRFSDRSLPKLDHLRRASQAGLLVPEPTLWAFACDLERLCDLHGNVLVEQVGLPCIVRSSLAYRRHGTKLAGRPVSQPRC